MAKNPAQRRYVTRFWPVMAIYVASVLAVSWLFNGRAPDGPLKYAIAVLPALPIIGIIVVMGRYLIEEQDEFIRLRHTIGLLIAIGLTLSFCAVWGFLEIYAGVPTIGLFNVVWGFFAAMGIGAAASSWWYR